MIAMRAIPFRRAPGNDSEKCGRALREERRRFGYTRPGFGRPKGVVIGRRRLEGERGVRRAGRQRGERVAELRAIGLRRSGVALAEVYQAAVRVGMLQRMQQRRLPAGEQRRSEDKPREEFS
jgi:hypothetical protein